MTPEDSLLIHRLLADYGHVVDDHDWARAHEVFAEDFVFDRSATGRPDLRGIPDIVANFLGRNMYAHVTTNITLTEIDADTVRGHSKFLGFPNGASFAMIATRRTTGRRTRPRCAARRDHPGQRGDFAPRTPTPHAVGGVRGRPPGCEVDRPATGVTDGARRECEPPAIR